VDFIINWIKGFFNQLFRFRLSGYKRRMESEVRRKTVGKAQGKMHKAMGKMDQKVFKAQNKALGGLGKNKKIGPGGGGPAAKKKGGGGDSSGSDDAKSDAEIDDQA